MKLNVKNFSSDNHRIRLDRNGFFLNAFYYKKEDGKFKVDQFFMVHMDAKEDYLTHLRELIQKIENYYGIELIKADLKIAQ